ncbi:MAG: hypothetical protein HYX68_25620 [Planctomycetes bacterium]|nr:hypothetical protein [Planctomycetota bacterium]
MKCREAQYWLYSFQPNAAWPVDVVGHLQQCADCQKVQSQLRQIDQQVNQLTSLPKNDRPIAQLFERLEQTPQTATPAPKPPARWWRWGSYVGAAAALVAIGWLLGKSWDASPEGVDSSEKTGTVEVVRDRIVTVHASAERGLTALLLKRNAQLVQSAQAKDRLETLLDMADDCRQHAIKLIDQGPRDYLPMTIDLYSQLLHQGVLVQLARAPATDRPMLEAVAKLRLRKMAEPVEGGPKTAKVLEQHRASLRSIALATIEVASNGKPLPVPGATPKWRDTEAVPATVALVQFAIAYSSETDPVIKADRCSDCVQRLMPYVKLQLADNPETKEGDPGQQFGSMIRFGVYVPLESGNALEPPAQTRLKMDRILRDADQTVGEMEKHMEAVSSAGQSSFQRAVRPTKKGWEKSRGNNKGKGKSKGKGGQSGRSSSVIPAPRVHPSLNASEGQEPKVALCWRSGSDRIIS